MGILLNLGLHSSFQLLQEKFRVHHYVHRLWHNKFSKINLLSLAPHWNMQCHTSILQSLSNHHSGYQNGPQAGYTLQIKKNK